MFPLFFFFFYFLKGLFSEAQWKHHTFFFKIFFPESISETSEGAPPFYEPVNGSGHLPSPLGQVNVEQLNLPSRGTVMIQDYPDLNYVS